MQLSIIIPMYNAEQFIDKLLDSIYLQDNHHVVFEVIIVDDCSQDQSVAIVQNYVVVNKVQNLHLVESVHNGGTASARNQGINLAIGSWIQFVDSDDLISDYYFQLIADKLEAEIDCYIYGFKTLYPDHIKHISPSLPIDQRMIGYRNSVVNKIFRTEMIKQFNPDYKFEDVIWLVEVMGSQVWRCMLIDNLEYTVNRQNLNSKMANVNQDAWRQMALDAISSSKSLNSYARAFVLETFVGTLFSDLYTVTNRLTAALYALLINYKYLPLVIKAGIRNKSLVEIEYYHEQSEH